MLFQFQRKVAGVVGFEPTVRGTKNRCLTTWLHPNGDVRITQVPSSPQDPESKKVGAEITLFCPAKN